MDTAMNYQTAQARLSRRAGRKASLFEAGLVRTALGRAFAMLNPAAMIRNPVMFVTEIGAALTTLTLILDVTGQGPALLPVPYTLAVTFVLWLTVLFANFAEALAEARGRAQADSLKLTRARTLARKLEGEKLVEVYSDQLRQGDLVKV